MKTNAQRPIEDKESYRCFCPHCLIDLPRTWWLCGGIRWCDACGKPILWETLNVNSVIETSNDGVEEVNDGDG